MTIEFHCVQCGKLLRTSAEKAGLEAKCPGCGTSVTVPHPATDREDLDDFDEFYDDEFGSDYDEFESPPLPGRMKNCPMCGEQIQAAAVKCRYCGEEIYEPGQSIGGAGGRTTGMAGTALGTGIASIVFSLCCGCFSIPLGISAVTFGFLALSEIKRNKMAGKGMAIAGIVCGFVSILLFVLILVLQIFSGGFDQFRQFRR